MLAERQDKMNRKIDDLTAKLQKGYEEKIQLEEESIKYQMFAEELITKMKPLLS
jgi:hypothetical protein